MGLTWLEKKLLLNILIYQMGYGLRKVSFKATSNYSKTCGKRPLSKDRKFIFKTNYRLMQVKSIAECSLEHSAILLTFIKLPFVIKIFILSIFEWPFYTGFTVLDQDRAKLFEDILFTFTPKYTFDS